MMALLTISLLLTGCGSKAAEHNSGTASQSAPAETAKEMTVKMLNVGQGDAILIETPEQTVLIDTSDLDEQEKLRAELKKAGIKSARVFFNGGNLLTFCNSLLKYVDPESNDSGRAGGEFQINKTYSFGFNLNF
jgi:ABC-type enterochelin transport system substrate-binding protein